MLLASNNTINGLLDVMSAMLLWSDYSVYFWLNKWAPILNTRPAIQMLYYLRSKQFRLSIITVRAVLNCGAERVGYRVNVNISPKIARFPIFWLVVCWSWHVGYLGEVSTIKECDRSSQTHCQELSVKKLHLCGEKIASSNVPISPLNPLLQSCRCFLLNNARLIER